MIFSFVNFSQLQIEILGRNRCLFDESWNLLMSISHLLLRRKGELCKTKSIETDRYLQDFGTILACTKFEIECIIRYVGWFDE